MLKKEKYKIGSLSVLNIRNRNETRVAKLISEILVEFPQYQPEDIDLQDIYALTLNKLRPRYTQECSLVLNEPVTDDMIKLKLRQAVKRVKKNPNH